MSVVMIVEWRMQIALGSDIVSMSHDFPEV